MIIKSAINSHTSILDLFQKIELQFNRVSTTIQYKNWAHSITGSILIHSSHDFSPIIDKWIIDYLTPTASLCNNKKYRKPFGILHNKLIRITPLKLRMRLNYLILILQKIQLTFY